MNFPQISDTFLLCKSFTCHLLIFDQSSVENKIGGEGSFVQSCPTIKIQDRCSRASANPGKAWSVRAKLALAHFLSSVCLFVARRHKSLHRSIANLGVYIHAALQVQPVSTSYRAMVIKPSSFKTLSPQLLNPSCIFPFQGGLNRGTQWAVSSNKDAANPWGTGCNLWREDQRGCSLETSPRGKGSAAVLQGAAWPGFPCRVHIGATFLFRSLEPSVQYLLRLAIFGSRSRVYLPAPAHCLVAGPRWL